MATVNIDGRTVELSDDQNLLHGCLSNGIDVPYFCWHPELGAVGACRLCAVTQYANDDDKVGRVVMSCMTPAKGVARISVKDANATGFRKQVVEWLMTNHPHDCPVCDAGGACHLQDMTVMTGHNMRKTKAAKRTYRNQNLGPLVHHEMNRCIQCYRCVRFYRDYAGGTDLGAFASKNHVFFGRHEEGTLESEFAGNLVEVCPTGVFTDKTMREHYTRKWDLQSAPSICSGCSMGCNITPGERYGTLRGVGNRYHHEINGYFICDRGRFGYEYVNSEDRPRELQSREGDVNRDGVIARLSQAVREGRAIGIGSPRASLETNGALALLVGKDKFFHGLNAADGDRLHRAVGHLRASGVVMATVQEVEGADAAFVLGENANDTAPRLALALRQAAMGKPRDVAIKSGIPAWHDVALRTAMTDQKGSLYLATPSATRLDDVAAGSFHAAPADLARLGFAVAHLIDPEAPSVLLTDAWAGAAQKIADALLAAERPVVIGGVSLGSNALIDAAANVAMALKKRGKNVGLFMVMGEANSVGVALLGGHPLEDAVAAVRSGAIDTVVVVENDLYRRLSSDEAAVLLSAREVIVLDHLKTPTIDGATVRVPVSAFFEDTGTVVNHEGRAQRFFEVYVPKNGMVGSWHWLAAARGASPQFDHVQAEVVAAFPVLAPIVGAAPHADFRIEGMKIARQSHRFSGRTAMNAAQNVSEPKPPQDIDSPYAFSMEGARGTTAKGLAAVIWAPSWNSNQAVARFQSGIGGPLKGSPLGEHLFAMADSVPAYHPAEVHAFMADNTRLTAVPLHHVFGSDETSAKAKHLATLGTSPYIGIAKRDAERRGLATGASARLRCGTLEFTLPVRVMPSLPDGVAGVPVLAGVPRIAAGSWVEVA